MFLASDTLIYAAHPSSQAPTQFKATAVSSTELTFENPAHDFPQRISYRKTGPDSIVARIEGDRAGRRAPSTFAFRRIDCAGETESATDVVQAQLQPFYDDLVARQSASVAGLTGWFAQHAAPQFEHIMWTTPGYRPVIGTREMIVRAAANQQAAGANVPRLQDLQLQVSIDAINARGDTAEVLVAARSSWKFQDTAGRYGAADASHARSSVQRRLDKWIRLSEGWRLASVAVISDEASVDGRPVMRDGRTIPW